MATLEKVASRLTRQRALVILLDGLDHFRPAVVAQSLSWLPESWPKHVHVVLTTDTADELSMRNLSNHINRIIRSQKLDRSVVEPCFCEIAALDGEEQIDMCECVLQRSQRQLMPWQREVLTVNFIIFFRLYLFRKVPIQ